MGVNLGSLYEDAGGEAPQSIELRFREQGVGLRVQGVRFWA